MAERAQKAVKKSEVKKASRISHTQNAELFQSMDSPVNRILYLQRTAGNRAVQNLIKSGAFQAKLRIGRPNDIYEQEADRVADSVMKMPEPQAVINSDSGHLVRLACPGCEEELRRQPEEGPIQPHPISEQITPLAQRQMDEDYESVQTERHPGGNQEVSPVPESQIQSLSGRGQTLSESVRAFFEPRFAYNFSHVRVHTGSGAAEAARSVNAKAFTVGNDIFFGAGHYSPEIGTGKNLLAHELTHVVQQGYNEKSHSPSQAITYQSSFSIFRTPVEVLKTYPSLAYGNPTSGIIIKVDSLPAQVDDNSKTVGKITGEFYALPREGGIPYGELKTIGQYGCPLRRYGLTSDKFSITYRLDDSDVRYTSRPSIGGSLVECWAWRVRFRLRLRQKIFIAKDLATHPCLGDADPVREREEILEHEHLHEFDNNAIAVEVGRRLRERLSFLSGIGRIAAMARITDDPHAFADKCRDRLRDSLEEIRDEHDMLYACRSTQMAIRRDPQDEALYKLKLNLLEKKTKWSCSLVRGW